MAQVGVETNDRGIKADLMKAALTRLDQYKAAKRISAVKAALAKKGVSKATATNWLSDAESISHAYRWRDFVDAVFSLPDIEREKRNAAYDFAFDELGIKDRGTQSDLSDYDGAFEIEHTFKNFHLKYLVIRVEHNPFVATFNFRYRYESRKEVGRCDGLLLTRYGKVILTGFSPSTSFYGVFQLAKNPRSKPSTGMAIIEDIKEREAEYSTVSLVPRELVKGFSFKGKLPHWNR